MEGAVKVTSGTANSRWELGLGGGVGVGGSLRDWEMVLRDVSCLLFIPEPQIRICCCNYCCVRRLNPALLIASDSISRQVWSVCVTPSGVECVCDT